MFSDGEKIPATVRMFYRGRPDLMAHFDDPFDVSTDSLRAWLQRERPELLQAG
jgi:hypothetical protein